MIITDIQNLTQTNSTLTGDFVHIFRNNEYGFLLSYKSNESRFTTLFDSTALASALEERIKAVKSKMDSLSAKFITKEVTDETYISKEKIELDKPGFLTQDKMESIVSKYPTKDTLKNYEAQSRQEANRLADETTDFAAAAMVGINQMGGGGEVPPPDGGGEEGAGG